MFKSMHFSCKPLETMILVGHHKLKKIMSIYENINYLETPSFFIETLPKTSSLLAEIKVPSQCSSTSYSLWFSV